MHRRLLHRPITVLMLFLGMCLFGGLAITRMPVQLLPSMELPRLTVITGYGGAAPEEMEELITRPMEEAIGAVNGVTGMESRSLEGLSIISARFSWDTDMKMSLVEAREKADLVRGSLPDDADRPLVIPFDPGDEPVLTYAVTDDGTYGYNLRYHLDKEIRRSLERIDGVASVELIGGHRREISVECHRHRLKAQHLSLMGVYESIAAENVSFPAGLIREGVQELRLRASGEFLSVEEMRQVPVGFPESGPPVLLGQVADVRDSYARQKSRAWYNGISAVVMMIRREPGRNILALSKEVKRWIGDNQDYHFHLVSDRSESIDEAVQGLLQAGLLGILAAFMVLRIFLGSWRQASVIATALPVGILGTFGAMYLAGMTLNTMSLGGLALGVGMMVDAGIVVLESLDADTGSPDAIAASTIAITPPLVASLLTTVVVFLPVLFLPGLSKALFGEMALSISFSLFFSLLSSVLLVPVLVQMLPARKGGAPLGLQWINRRYTRLLLYIHERRRPFLAFILLLIILSVGGIFLLPRRVLPAINRGEYLVRIDFSAGTPLDESDERRKVAESMMPQGTEVLAITGADPADSVSEKLIAAGSHTLRFRLNNRALAKSENAVDEIARHLPLPPHSSIEITRPKDPLMALLGYEGKAFLECYGNTSEERSRITEEMMLRLKKADLSLPVPVGAKKAPELRVVLDRTRAALSGIHVEEVATEARVALHGIEATRYRDGDDEVPVRVSLRGLRGGDEEITDVAIAAGNGAMVPLGSLATIEEAMVPLLLYRRNRRGVDSFHIAAADMTPVRTALGDMVSENMIGFHDSSIEVRRMIGEMSWALAAGVLLIYMVLASQFQSFRLPLRIMGSIPLVLPGAVLALLLSGESLNMQSVTGLIMLSGLVVNNAIILMDRIEQDLRVDDLFNSVKDAAISRIRPVIMTVLTTMSALLPLAFGVGAGGDLQRSMALTVIGGLLVSTAGTLLFIPLFYLRER